MHKYRRQAKYAAWYDEDPQSPSYNPFKKFRSTSLREDPMDTEENGLAPTASESQIRSSSDQTRRREIGRSDTNDEPSRSATLPNDTTKPLPHEHGASSGVALPRSESPIREDLRQNPVNIYGIEKETNTAGLDSKDFKDSTDTDTAVASNHVGGEGNQPRQRKGIKGLMGKFKKGGKKGDPDRSDSKVSTKSKNKQQFTAVGQLKATLFNSWINVLLIAVPVGIAVHYTKLDPVGVFVINFIAIVPLAAMLSYATEEIAFRTGEVLGGLLNATFGNAVELIVSIIALTQNQVLIVQTSLIGSMLSNLLLVMGMCFFFGGINRVEQHFNITVAQTASSLLALAVGSLIIPTAFHSWSGAGNAGVGPLSRGTSVILLFVYACYLFFQLKTHTDMYNAPSEKVEKRTIKIGKGEAKHGIAQLGAMGTAVAGANREGEHGKAQKPLQENDNDDAEAPQLSLWVAIATLGISTVFVALCAEYLVDSIDALVERGGISKTFVGLILLPIVGNAAEHATAVTVAVKDKMDLAIGVAVGSSMQIALLVLPLVVVLGWIMGKNDIDTNEMTLNFDGFQIAILFVAVLLVNYLIQDGKSHWLEGILLQTLYIIIAVAAWFYPTKGNVTG